MDSKLDTILFDLDGTLLQIPLDSFINAYMNKLQKVFTALDMDAAECIKAVWVGTGAMVDNDGSMRNDERFWKVFIKELSLSEKQCRVVEAACNEFYVNEFDTIKSIMPPNEISGRLIRTLQTKGYEVVLATNPLLPSCAVTTRLRWLGLEQEDFALVTHYSNSTFCKPNLKYYEEVFTKINQAPEQCLMVGNDIVEDMVAGELGAKTYLVTDCLENKAGLDIAAFRHGTLSELEEYLGSFPEIKAR